MWRLTEKFRSYLLGYKVEVYTDKMHLAFFGEKQSYELFFKDG